MSVGVSADVPSGGGKQGERRVVANVLRGSIGNLVEWYDWYVHTTL
ncbi:MULTISPECIES: hypothetical protein [unclassified Crossiella]|nr:MULTISPECIES: hypothetical protein [unclassified Crossiella]MCK2242194.1 hypothetical protein [Crossiella sp. S99.2]MCK2256097.1 hypothetical protein [Crossiella sp. S99.1]